jgi:DNA polymerase-3 subunit delta
MTSQNIHLFFGPNQFGCMRELQRWKSAFVAKYSDFDVEVIDGKRYGADHIIQCCDTHPFMSEKRLVIVRDFLPEGGKKEDSDENDDSGDKESKKDRFEPLIDYFQRFPDSCVLVFVSINPDKRTRVFKALSEAATLHEFKEVKGVTFLQWLRDETKRLGGSIEPRALEYFALHTGEDMWRAASELEKLALYTDKPITVADVDQVVSSNVQVKIFAFVDTLGSKNIAKALKLFTQLLDRGENIFMVFNMIIRQFRLLLQIRSLKDNGVDRRVIMSRLRLAPFQINTLARQADNFTFDNLRAIYQELLSLDIALKTGKIPSSGDRQELFVLALERFFVRHGFTSEKR